MHGKSTYESIPRGSTFYPPIGWRDGSFRMLQKVFTLGLSDARVCQKNLHVKFGGSKHDFFVKFYETAYQNALLVEPEAES